VVAQSISWHPDKEIAAFNLGNYVNDDERRRQYSLKLWQNNTLSTIDSPNKEWVIGKTASISWSENGERLYFENHPKLAAKIKAKEYTDEASLYDFDTIREHKALNVWHNNDAQIKPREEQQWNKVNKNRHYSAVFHLKSQKAVQLSNEKVSDLALNTNRSQSVLGYSNQAHLEKIMYGGFFAFILAASLGWFSKYKRSPFSDQLIDAFELWCWRRLLRVPWTARRSNESILKEISPEYSLEGLMLNLNLQYFGHLMRTTDSFEKILMPEKTEGRRRGDGRG